MRLKIILLIIFSFYLSSNINAQSPKEFPSKNFFLNVARLSKYLASEEFLKAKENITDNQAVNLIYLKSLSYSGSISEALLTATFATLPFKYFPLVLPLTKLKISIPLPVGPLNLFNKKISQLPSHLFFDSPKSKRGDVDKLAHFFANAFLVYNLHCTGLSNFLGMFVEIFERNFKVNGFVDRRDLFTNKLGAFFGATLIKNKFALPSDFFVIYDLNYLKLNPF